MNEDIKNLCDKMNRLIETSDKKHKAIVERYLSLANRQLHLKKWSEVIGASLALKEKFEAKFGTFMPRDKPIYVIDEG